MCQSISTASLSLSGTGALSSQIPHLACSVYHITLKDLPAMVRLWWNSCEKRVFSVVDKFTSKYVSSVLSSQEISSVQTSTQLFNGMTVSKTFCPFFLFTSAFCKQKKKCYSSEPDCSVVFCMMAFLLF